MNALPPRPPLDILLAVLHRIEDGLLVGLLLAMILIAALQIAARNVLGTSFVWGDVAVRIMVLWIGLIGAMIASRKGEHIRIDLLARLMPGRFQTVIDAIMQLITAALCFVTSVYAFRFVRSEFEYGGIAFAGVPAWICESIVPVAFFVISLRYLALSIHHFRGQAPPDES